MVFVNIIVVWLPDISEEAKAYVKLENLRFDMYLVLYIEKQIYFATKKSWISKLWLSDNDGGVISSGRPSIWEIFQPKSLNILFF